MKKVKWIGLLALVLCISLSACTGDPQDKPKTPVTTDITATVFTRMVIQNGETYFSGESLILSGATIDAIGEAMQLESWVPIFKPIYPYNIDFVLLDANHNRFSFGLYDNKLLIVANINSEDYYFEASKSIYAPIKAKLDETYESNLALPSYRESVLVSATLRNTPDYYGWVKVKLPGPLDSNVLEGALKRNTWLIKATATKATGETAFQLTDSTGMTYRFVSLQGEPDQVEIYSEPLAQTVPLAYYMVPDQVIENTLSLLTPLIVTSPAGEYITQAVFVKAYLDMWFYFDQSQMLSDYGYTFTSAQKTVFNAIDRSTWFRLIDPVDSMSAIFALIDSKGNQYFFDGHQLGASIKVVPKANPSQPEYYIAPNLNVEKLYNELLAANPVKGVLPIVKTVTFTSVYERAESTEYQKISSLTVAQSNQLIALLDYSSWTQKVGFQAGGWWFQFKAVTSSGLDYMFGFNYAVVTLPDKTQRIYNLTPEVMTAISNFINNLK